jgi:hypothetical protein
MDARIQVVAIVAAAALILVLLDLVRRRRLLERYALLWLSSAVILLALAIWRDLLAKIADLVGVAYPPNALFLIAFGFVLVLLLHFSLAVSRMSDQIKVLAQRLALLDEHVREQERGAVAERDRSDAEAFIRD